MAAFRLTFCNFALSSDNNGNKTFTIKQTKTMNTKSRKLYYLFRDEIIKAEEEQMKKKKNQK